MESRSDIASVARVQIPSKTKKTSHKCDLSFGGGYVKPKNTNEMKYDWMVKLMQGAKRVAEGGISR